MYHQYFGLNDAPFSIAVNPRYLFMSARHRDALAHLLYGVGAGGGFILLTGEVGTGKTTINRCLLEQLPQDTDIAIILNPALNAMELLATACDELNIEYDSHNPTLKTLTDKLHAYLLENHRQGRSTVLMIDEAQHLDFDVLEQIRLLTNLETNTRKLLQIILIGQPELVELLNRPELRQLNQRITARYNLEPLNLQETSAYIKHRLSVAGLAPGRELFPASVVRGIFKRTRGIPRLVNVLCDRILLGAYGRNRQRADSAMLKVAAKEVMGQERGTQGSDSKWIVASVSLLVLLIVGLSVWSYTQWLSPEPGAQPLIPQSQEVIVGRSGSVDDSGSVRAEIIVAEEPLPAVAPEVPLRETWLLPPQNALERLWALEAPTVSETDPCVEQTPARISCVEGVAQTWEELWQYDRPLALKMVTPDRFGASVLLLGIEGSDGYVSSDSGVALVSLAELGPLWSGEFAFLWHRPAGFLKPLAYGDRNPVVTEIARMFSQLDGQEAVLSNERFSNRLKERVMLFQKEHKLEADGVIGVRTLLKLNEQLGIDLTAQAARARLETAIQEIRPE
ncbi:MAG: general secretion pathway protein A [Halioglobus sp.]|jgi:general secretion pathway protein A